MKAYVLKQAENHNEYTLIINGNSFGDQLIQVERETLDGYTKCVFLELNHEGNHREITPSFVDYMRAQVMKGLIK
jgi:hypothetical protein